MKNTDNLELGDKVRIKGTLNYGRVIYILDSQIAYVAVKDYSRQRFEASELEKGLNGFWKEFIKAVIS